MVTHTGALADGELAEIRALCELVYTDYDEDTWQQCLGGMHARVRVDGDLVAHASLVLRRLRVDGRWRRCGWVESVAVHPAHRRRGHGHTVMAELEVLAPGFEMLGLCSSDEGLPLYESRGWQRWRGPADALTPDGLRATPEEDSIYVKASAPLDLDGPITCDWREGDLW